MSLSHRERMQRALTHQSVDRIPTQINYTAAMAAKMAAHFDIPLKRLPHFLDNHMIRVDVTYPDLISDDGLVKFDWWGVGFSTKEEGYFASVNPLKENRDLDAFPWPDPLAPSLLDEARDIIEADGGEHFIVPNLGFLLFERAWTLRGLEVFFMDMVQDPVYTEELLDRITDIQLALIHRYIDLGVDGGYFGDDYGAQNNLMFSPKMWRRYIKPRLARLFEPFRERNLPIIMHSDGDISMILPDLVEIGLTVYNPVQPEVTDFDWLRQTFGGRLAFYGGVSTQSTLPFGTPGDVRASVQDCVARLAPDCTGLLIAPSHRMMSDIPMVNVESLLQAFRDLGCEK